jgi:hypothetical protein
MQNPLTMHATLALAAGFWAASTATSNAWLVRECYRQKGEAIMLVKAHLSAFAKGQLVANEVLAGIACLANAEVSLSPSHCNPLAQKESDKG